MLSFFQSGLSAKLLVGCVVLVTLSFIIYDVSQRYEVDVSVARAVSPTTTLVPPTATPVPPTATPSPPTATPIPPTATPAPPTATPVPPTATPVPPTATPIPPTATPVPPTATPIPPTATPIPPTATPVPPISNIYTPSPPTATPAPPTATPIPPTATPTPQYELLKPGSRPTAAAWFDDNHMYIADYAGSIRLLNIRTGEARKVIDSLSIPRGLTILDGRLYVSEMGSVCTRMYEYLEYLADDSERHLQACVLRWIKRMHKNEVIVRFVLQNHARILSYRVHESGNLSDRQTVVDGLISVGHAHAPNGLANDGEYVYASIGHPQGWIDPNNLFNINAELFAENGRRPELMGAIARFRPPDGEVEVFANGLRNTYQISIAPDGTIYGADNDVADGLSTEGHLEELNAIVKGGFYGFPFWGTYEAPPEENVTEPVAILNGSSSTAAYANEEGVYVAYRDDEIDRFVVDRFDYETFTPTRIFGELRTYITSILERDGLLYIFTFAGDVYIIDPALAPIAWQE